MATQRNSRVGAVVLAAGRSSRMGTAKQLLPLGDTTVLESTLEKVQNSALDEVILVLGACVDSIRARLADSAVEGIRIVTNPDYEEGMASSLRTGIAAVGASVSAALIILADQPFVRPDTIRRIVEEYRRSTAQIVIPTHAGVRGNPVLLDRSVFHEVMTLKGDVGFRAIFDAHLEGIVKVEVGDPGILLDIDNREDYERLRQLHAREGSDMQPPE